MATRTNPSGASGLGRRAVTELRESVLAKVATLGAILFALSVLLEMAIRVGFLERGISAVWAVIFLVWGTALVVLGVAGRVLIWWRRR
ncbi:hypothetical protein [Halosimplex halophilum]|uniref:hypothetical protein n=1 Tax=Halosimplex halophilum TaxID=2559572 RepID=UPI00107FC1C8|nr:hypothetical protein [Halosimplex halophilum]